MTSRFACDTAVAPRGDGLWTAELSEGWSIMGRPNGGYLAAVVLRAITAEVDDPARRPRSLTLHYLRPPQPGPAEIVVILERSGRTLTTATARLRQGGKDHLLAVAALADDRDGVAFDEPAPQVPPPEELPEALAPPAEWGIAIRERFEQRAAFGPGPFEGGDEALSGGWIRLADPEPLDDHVLVALTDAWFPAVFGRVRKPLSVPTVDLTVHLRHPAPAEHEWVLVRFRSRYGVSGYVEEDGEVWDTRGNLLAQSRQLAILI